MGPCHRHLESSLLESVVRSHSTIQCDSWLVTKSCKVRLISPVMRLLLLFCSNTEKLVLVLDSVGLRGWHVWRQKKDRVEVMPGKDCNVA